MKFFVICSIYFLLTACQSTLIQKDAVYYESASSSTLEILKPIEVAPNSARAFLQGGELVPQGKINLYRVNCEVEINTVSETRQIIQPEKFKIISISQNESPIVMIRPSIVASLTYSWASESPVDIKRFYQFRLSPVEPDSKSEVRALICRGVQSEPYQAELPTFEQILRYLLHFY